MTSPSFKPIYALADSRLLFWKRADGYSFLKEVVKNSGAERPSVAYIGASNGDSLEFYHGIFEPAMQPVGVGECRMILTRPAPQDAKFLECADIILLAGGSVEVGWRAFERNGFKELIQRRHAESALLIGVSAGAVQLGMGGLTDDGSMLHTFAFLPFYVSAHEEPEDWASLRKISGFVPGNWRGIGIPAGGGIIYRSDELEPVCKPVFEIWTADGKTREGIVLPLNEDGVE